MKICHISTAHNNTDIRIRNKECVSLAKNHDYEVFLIIEGNSYTYEGVNIVGIGERPKSRKDRAFAFVNKAYKKALELDADIYHLHDPELLRIALKLKKHGKKVIYDSHEDTISDINRKEYIPKVLRKCIAFVFSKYLKRISSKVDGVISVTPDVCKQYERWNSNVAMVTNFPIVSTNIERPALEHNKKEGTILFFAGGVSSMWSHDHIIKAMDGIEEIKYELYGIPDESYLQTLKTMPSWSKVNYHGVVPFNEVDQNMWSADIGMALMQYIRGEDKTGTLGNTKLFEIMLHGLPVIATDFILWKEIVEKNNCGICINPNDAHEIAKAISYLMNNKDIAKKMGENGRNTVLEKYTWGSQETELYKFYEKVVMK